MRRGSRVAVVADALRSGILAGDHAAGERLPTETQLAASFEVSRPTVRAALRELEATGLVRTQHGVGSFVVDQPAVRAGLERLDSISESIRRMGKEPGMAYKSRVVRPLLPEEASKLDVAGDALGIELRRSILADGDVVAYSYDVLPAALLQGDPDADAIDGSIFAYLRDTLGLVPHHAIAEVHAVASDHIGWGPTAAHSPLYLLLDQVHFDREQRPLMYSRTYFLEGRYAFTIVRNT